MNNSKFTDMKLKIYEENAYGNISDEERDFLLEMVDIKYEEVVSEATRESKNIDIMHKKLVEEKKAIDKKIIEIKRKFKAGMLSQSESDKTISILLDKKEEIIEKLDDISRKNTLSVGREVKELLAYNKNHPKSSLKYSDESIERLKNFGKKIK